MSEHKLQQLISHYLSAYKALDSKGCAEAFTADGALFSPYGPPARGRQAIADTHTEWFAEPEEDKTLEVLEYNENEHGGYCLLGWSARVPVEGSEDKFSIASGVSLCVLSGDENELRFTRLALVPDSI
ncbi:MAG: hypothetical protein AAF402_00215 [Pseudomonadota bacterium]